MVRKDAWDDFDFFEFVKVSPSPFIGICLGHSELLESVYLLAAYYLTP